MLLDRRGETLSVACRAAFPRTSRAACACAWGRASRDGWRTIARRCSCEPRGQRGAPSSGAAYNSDSFLSVPVLHNDTLHGVLNFSNKADGALFGDADLDRAMFLATVLAMSRERATAGKRQAMWS